MPAPLELVQSLLRVVDALHGVHTFEMLMQHEHIPLPRLFSPGLALAREILNRLS